LERPAAYVQEREQRGADWHLVDNERKQVAAGVPPCAVGIARGRRIEQRQERDHEKNAEPAEDDDGELGRERKRLQKLPHRFPSRFRLPFAQFSAVMRMKCPSASR